MKNSLTPRPLSSATAALATLIVLSPAVSAAPAASAASDSPTREGPQATTESKLQCVEDHTQGQLLSNNADLIGAQAAFEACAAAHCPTDVRVDCAALYEKARGSIPTIVIEARDESGRDVDDLNVLVDGLPLADSTDGLARVINPGGHVLTFERAGAKVKELRVVIREGEKLRRITVEFDASEFPATDGQDPDSDRSVWSEIPTASYVLAGVGVASFTAAAPFWIKGLGCEHSCRKDDWQTGDIIGFGIGGASLVAAGTVWLLSSDSPEESSPSPNFSVSTTGTSVWVSGQF